MKRILFLLVVCVYTTTVLGQKDVQINVNAEILQAKISPALHGVFFEEISHGGEGGLYAELIQNRGFEEARLPLATTLKNGMLIPDRKPHFSIPNNGISDWAMPWALKSKWPSWALQTSEGTDIRLKLTTDKPLTNATPHSLQIDIHKLSKQGMNNLVNEGYWGMNIVKGETYNLYFFARTKDYDGPVTASLQAANGEILASCQFKSVKGNDWKKYSCSFLAVSSNSNAKFVLSFGSTGTVYLDFVSLFPARTFKNRPNGLRADLAKYIADLKPAFVRWPGGCFVEGINIENTPSWRRSIGPVEERPGTYSPWGYWSSDGFGYHEFLQFCEDINADALYVFNAGVSCDFRSGTFIPDESVDSIIQDVLDGIEYAIGPTTSVWGKVRAANGHPKPFPLKYVEIGNEQVGPRYARRYNWFYDAIKKKYPQLEIIASMGIGDANKYTLDSMQKVEWADEHAYKPAYWAMRNWDHFDKYKRGNWNMYVGEYATNSGVGKGNMLAALCDAVYIMSMERNGDLVKMSSYAPLLVNENDVDWPVNLIHFNAAKSFARISYYGIQMLNQNRANQNLLSETILSETKEKSALYEGGIGLATWDTKAEFKDVEVKENGITVYKSDFTSNANGWKSVLGKWDIKEGAFAQSSMGAQRFSWLANRKFSTYTLTLKARKTSDATNAFIIPFAVKDDRTMLRAHIGSYVNRNCVFETVSNGFDVADLTAQKKLSSPIETNRWYEIKLEVGYDRVDCFLDGKLLMSYTEPQKIFSIAGRDHTNGDIIVKIVNATSQTATTTLNIKGVKPGTEAKLFSLAAESPDAENSFDNPLKYIPQETTVTGKENKYQLLLQPWSISVIRLSDKAWK